MTPATQFENLSVESLDGDQQSNRMLKPCKIDNFEIVWIQKGSGIHFVNHLNVPITEDSVFFLCPGEVHQLKATGKLTGYIISFSEGFLRRSLEDVPAVHGNSLFAMFAGFGGIQMTENIRDEIYDFIPKLVREINRSLPMKTEMIRYHLKTILLYLLRESETKKAPLCGKVTNSLASRFLNAVNTDFKLNKLVNQYADKLAVSANHLNEVVKNSTGHSAGYHIRQRVISEAKRKAAYSTWNMKEIAFDLGFDTSSHFSKFFKANAGVNFSNFKRRETGLSI